MKRWGVLLSLALLLLSGCGGAGKNKAEWQRFESEQNRFSILFPGAPQEFAESVPTEVGTIEAQSFVVQQGDGGFAVNVVHHPPEAVSASDPQTMLDAARDRAVANVSGELLEEKDVTLGGYPGREIQVEIADGQGMVRSRFYLVENRLYAVQTISQKPGASTDVDRFLDSFQLTP
jgi:hypothetical protein